MCPSDVASSQGQTAAAELQLLIRSSGINRHAYTRRGERTSVCLQWPSTLGAGCSGVRACFRTILEKGQCDTSDVT
ncbi:unnamed protein product [Rangifer tarandus platyrhynchus]|uniref:Uncharacterized protein n=1 Tax=Rangifer tarandus platyrhynchus TaxID=3082113 RepID=A0ABN8XI54_RANTA|nr:unnamed protein product [Rangifer tarandus platyrhynchus]